MRERGRVHQGGWVERSETRGIVRIQNDVIGRIASIAAREVSGVAGVWEGIRLGLGPPWLGGVRARSLDAALRISLPIIAEYGVNLPRVAMQVQERVREVVHRMTDISAIEVDVSVHGVREPREEGRP